MTYYVYLLTNTNKNVLYTGITSDLVRRIYEHKNKLFKGFSSKYNVNQLGYYEIYENIEGVVLRLKEEINPHQEI